MSAPIRFALMISVSERVNGRPPYLSANVQCWNKDDHVVTIKLAEYVDLSLPETADLDTVENYAVVAARAVASHLADIQMCSVENGHYHTRHDLVKEADDRG